MALVFLETSGLTSGVESVLKLIGLIILCAIIIVASYFTTRFVGNRQAGMMGESNFKSLDMYRINQTKYLQLIQIGTRYFVISVCKDTVNVIAELSKEEITYWRSDKKVSFKEVLAKAVTGKSEEKEEETSDSEKIEQ